MNNRKLEEVTSLLDIAIKKLKGLKETKYDRFVLDVRVGIAGIVDTHHESYDVEHEGLHPTDPWLIMYIDAERVNNAWELNPIELKMLKSFVQTLNMVV